MLIQREIILVILLGTKETTKRKDLYALIATCLDIQLINVTNYMVIHQDINQKEDQVLIRSLAIQEPQLRVVQFNVLFLKLNVSNCWLSSMLVVILVRIITQ